MSQHLELLNRLVDAIKAEEGDRLSPTWEAVFRRVPRHCFVRDFDVWNDGQPSTHVATGDENWWQRVYSDEALITSQDADRFLSSSSRPSVMARFLELLQVEDGDTVLEIGTGTGYNAALLCERLGDQLVTSVDIDAELVEAAAAALLNCGYRPTLAVADGALGYRSRAPYARILATCSVARIPAAWSQQLRPNGTLVAPLASGLLVSLRRDKWGALVGRADAMTVGFMRLRSATLPDESVWAPFAEKTQQRSVEPPEAWLPSQRVRFHARLMVPDLEIAFEDGDWSLASRLDGSWSRLRRFDDGDHVLVQGGPRRLWDLYLAAAMQWVELGRPEASRYGLTVQPDGRHVVWLDEPEAGPAWELQAAVRGDQQGSA